VPGVGTDGAIASGTRCTDPYPPEREVDEEGSLNRSLDEGDDDNPRHDRLNESVRS